MKSIKVGFKGKKISVRVKELSYFFYWLGLMFKSRDSENLLFDLPGRWGIHSFFVFFPFLALWLDEKNKVLEWKVVKPFSVYVKPRKKFAKLVEIPINSKNKGLIQNFINTESI